MNIRQTVPRIDCRHFAKCGKKSLAHCRQYRGTAPDCLGCTLIRRKPKNRVISDGKELKRCTHCGQWLPLYRFYERKIVRGEKIYYSLFSECKFCLSKAVINKRKK